ncbi:MAG: hypothetical protein RI897_922 [Verrucomicrobiota bacterium]
MEKIRQIELLIVRSGRLPWLVLVVVWVVLAAVIVLTARPVREGIRSQLIEREGDILYPLVVGRLDSMANGEFAEDPEDPAIQLGALLGVRQLEGVVGIRLFDREGSFVESFPLLTERDVPELFMAELRGRRPVCWFEPRADLADYFFPETEDELIAGGLVPLLEVYVPLHVAGGGDLVGLAEFVLSGDRLEAAFASLDRRLWLQAGGTFVISALLVGVVFGWAIRRLNRLHGDLAERTEGLLRANAELALAARTTALGAITSHLVHGLRSPLAGLQNLVSFGRDDPGGPAPEDWEQAAASMRRMQNLIAEVVQVLREQPESEQYRVSLRELVELVEERTRGVGSERGVVLETQCGTESGLDNRTANLASLILSNLVQNGMEATQRGGCVRLSIEEDAGGGISMSVRDEGGGMPEGVRARLFQPVASSKEGGSGLGLAISRQLALHLGARLELVESGVGGCWFRLWLPLAEGALEEIEEGELSRVELEGGRA